MRHKSTELMGSIKAFVEDYYNKYRHSPSTTQIADAVGIARGICVIAGIDVWQWNFFLT